MGPPNGTEMRAASRGSKSGEVEGGAASPPAPASGSAHSRGILGGSRTSKRSRNLASPDASGCADGGGPGSGDLAMSSAHATERKLGSRSCGVGALPAIYQRPAGRSVTHREGERDIVRPLLDAP